MLLLKDGEEGKPLNYEEIVKREIDMEKFRKHLADFNAGIMPGQGEDHDAHGAEPYRRRAAAA